MSFAGGRRASTQVQSVDVGRQGSNGRGREGTDTVGAPFLLPIPPSVNKMYRNVPGIGRVKTTKYRDWFAVAGYRLLRQQPEKHKGDVILNLQFGPRNKRADVSNLIKATEDLLVKMGVIEDDRFVVSVLAAWNDSVDGCQVDVRAA